VAIVGKSMKRNCRRRSPVLDQFESRKLLTTGVTGIHTAALLSAEPNQLIVPLSGTLQGQFVDVDKIPDVGATFTLSGSGHVRGIGSVSTKATIHTIGFIQIGPVQGTVVLKGAKGTITVNLTAVERGGGATGLPIQYKYKIIGGTGDYTNAVDHGTATLATAFSKTGGGTFGVQHGHFKLVFASAFAGPTA
jgi:hypothetical protein